MGMPDHVPVKQQTNLSRPLIGELVGLAGAGKTTLLRALSQRDEKIRVISDLEIRDRSHIPIFVRYAPYLSSLFLERWRGRSLRGFNWDEMKAMVYLREWPHIIRQQAVLGGTAVLLNHGPIFKLATLDAFGPETLKTEAFQPWWHEMFTRWASTLDMIIWLHAPDETLVERINGRDQRHAVKGKSEREATQFLRCYQTSYKQMLAKLAADGGPLVLQFDTSQASVEQIVEEVLVACRSHPFLEKS
jgi:shikimate kinase